MTEVGGMREWRSPKCEGLLRKEGPRTYAILSRNLLLSQFICFLKGFRRAFNESNPAFGELSMNVNMLSEDFQQMSACLWRACFQRAFNESQPDLRGLSESFHDLLSLR